jgi:L-aspartate oxidase
LKRSGESFVWLDLSAITRTTLERRFPGILAECERRGHRLPAEPLPVVPAAHYACGGVRTEASGQTTLPGLYAAGEVACTGVHGANRLASNSLLEAVVYSHRAAAALPLALRDSGVVRVLPMAGAAAVAPEPGPANADSQWRAELRGRIRDLMWTDVGIVRGTDGLRRAAAGLASIRDALRTGVHAADADSVELGNLAETAALIIMCAERRRESRGLHHMADFPYRDNERFLSDTVLVAERR